LFNYLGHNARWLTLSYLVWGVGEGLWIYILPLYAAELGADAAQIGLVLSVMGLVRVPITLLAGWLADRIGPRRVMPAAWLAGTVGVIGVALAPDWHWLVPAIAVYGLSGFAPAVAGAYLNRVVELERDERPRQTFSRVLTTLNAGYSAGLILSPGVGGWLGERLGLRAVFVISTGWFILSTLAAWRTRPVPLVPRQPGSGYRVLFRQRWLLMSVSLMGVAFTVVTLVSPMAMTSKFLADERGLDVSAIGALGSINALGITLLSLALGRDERPLRSFTVALALVWASAGLVLVSHHLFGLALAYLMMGGVSAARPLIESAILPRARGDQRGMVMGALESSYSLGTSAGTVAAGALYANPGPQAPFALALLALPVVGAVCWLVLSAGQRLGQTRGVAQ
jgi:MFS family permease